LSNMRNSRGPSEPIADRYDDHAALETEVGSRLLERTTFKRKAPEYILDLGCGTGTASASLKQQFRKARVIGMDRSLGMLTKLLRRSGMLKPLRAVCGDLAALPFATRSTDMLFSNLAVYWCPDPVTMFSEFRRVLRPDGMLLFSTLGPSTLRELRAACSRLDASVEWPQFPDLMEVGDALMSAGFREPVMDMEMIVLNYPDIDSMLTELQVTGNSRLIQGWDDVRRAGGKLQDAWEPITSDDTFSLSFEIVYGVAFGPQDGQPVKTRDGDVATFPVESLRRRRKVP